MSNDQQPRGGAPEGDFPGAFSGDLPGEGPGRFPGDLPPRFAGQDPNAPGAQEGWGGEYDSDTTAYIEFSGGYSQEPGGEPLAAPGHGYQPPVIDEPTVAPATPGATTDPGATGQWTMPFAYDAASPSAPRGAALGAAAMGQGAAALSGGGSRRPLGAGPVEAAGHEAAGHEVAGGGPAGATPVPEAPGPWSLPSGGEPHPVAANEAPGPAAASQGTAGATGAPERGEGVPDGLAPRGESAEQAARTPEAAPTAPTAPTAPAAPAASPEHTGPGETAEPPASAAAGSGTADEAGPAPSRSDHPEVSYVLRVNGVDRPVTGAWIGESLLYVLRERLGLAGAKDGCAQGECGACSVQVDGRLVAACLVPAATAAGTEIRTVEGLGTDGAPSDVQRALAATPVQCGFCLPGMAMTVHDLLEGNHAPTELETRTALSGNLCRCTGYRSFLDAVRRVVEERAEAAARAAEGGPPPQGESAAPRIPHQAGPPAGGM